MIIILYIFTQKLVKHCVSGRGTTTSSGSDKLFKHIIRIIQCHESYVLSLLSENNKCDSISEYTPNHGAQTYGSPTEQYNQDIGLDLGPKYLIGSLEGDHKII